MSEERKMLNDEELDNVAGGLISFEPLWNYLETHEISTYQLIKSGIITPAELTKMRANYNFNMSFINRLCSALNCQPWEIIKYIEDEDI